MGTRADFYMGRGEQAEWLGSIAFDGYPEGNPALLGSVETEAAFRRAVESLLALDHATRPGMGWPWPWDNSQTTDYAYAWEDGVWVSCFGHGWDRWADYDPDDELERPHVPFPDMSAKKQTTFGRAALACSLFPRHPRGSAHDRPS